MTKQYVYAFVDSRSVDRYEDFMLFKNREDAENMRKSMGSDMIFFKIHRVEVIN